MILLKKDFPEKLQNTWVAAMLNVGVVIFQLVMYFTPLGTIINLVGAALSAGVVIALFVIMNKKAAAMVWDRLRRVEGA